MKNLFLSMVILASVATRGETFVTTVGFNAQTTNYTTPKIIEIEVLEMNQSEMTAQVLINGNIKELRATLKSTTSDMDERIYNYNMTIKIDYLANSMGCDEAEVVKYVANFDLEKDTRDPHTPDYFRVKTLTAKRVYYWDECHDLNPEIEIIKYSKK